MKTLGKQLAQAWEALSQADLGETADYAERLRRIGVTEDEIARQTAPISTASLLRPRRLIALASRGPVLRAALDYVREAIPRLEVDVAVVSAADAPPLDRQFADACADEGATLIEETISGHFERGLRHFVDRHPQTLFVVIGDRMTSRGWMSRLPVPVVRVVDLENRPVPLSTGGAA